MALRIIIKKKEKFFAARSADSMRRKKAGGEDDGLGLYRARKLMKSRLKQGAYIHVVCIDVVPHFPVFVGLRRQSHPAVVIWDLKTQKKEQRVSRSLWRSLWFLFKCMRLQEQVRDTRTLCVCWGRCDCVNSLWTTNQLDHHCKLNNYYREVTEKPQRSCLQRRGRTAWTHRPGCCCICS